MERHRWLYESDYYQELLHTARLTSPTLLTSSGEKIVIKHACVNRESLSCRLLETFFAPNLSERTGGQMRFEVASFYELSVVGSYVLESLEEGILDSAAIPSWYVGNDIPQWNIERFWGIYLSREQAFMTGVAIISDIENVVLEHTGGVILNHSWISGVDMYLFCTNSIHTPKDFASKTILGFTAYTRYWADGMGARSFRPDYFNSYTGLEREIVDCILSSSIGGYNQNYHEVADYMIGNYIVFYPWLDIR